MTSEITFLITLVYFSASNGISNAIGEVEVSSIPKTITNDQNHEETWPESYSYLTFVDWLKAGLAEKVEEICHVKNHHSTFKIETLNIYHGANGNIVPFKPTEKDSFNTTALHLETEDRLNKFSEIKASLHRMEKRLGELEKYIYKINKLDSIYAAFQGVKAVLGKSPYSNRLYIFPVGLIVDFHEAKSYCEDRNTTLASIHSQGEYNFVKDWLSTNFKVYSHFWLGHQRPASTSPGSSDNEWHDGTTIDHVSWGPGDNGGKPNSFGCMFMCHYCGDALNGWYIRPCSNKSHFLCQKVL